MIRGAAFRGQPLLLLAGLMAGWLLLRLALWAPPFEVGATTRLADAGGGTAFPPKQAVRVAVPAQHAEPFAQPMVDPFAEPVLPRVAQPGVPVPLEPPQWREPLGPVGSASVPAATSSTAPRAVIGHNLLFMAGLSQMQVPPALLAHLKGDPAPTRGIPAAAPLLAAAPPRAAPASSRWSADGWLLLRDDTTTPILSGRPSYGRSQAGAVVRYSLARSSALRPQAYLRVSSALAGAREQEVAAGISARPLAGVPLRLAVEARVGETARGTRGRPAAFAVTEFPPLRLPHGARAEVYAQGGYFGGAYATAFADGQARVERPLVRRGETELAAGAGMWGGAQRGAARLDIGPAAAVTFRLGQGRGRVAADYRFRLAGDAEPSSGPALTVSAGF